MKKSTSSNRLETRGIIEPLEARIAPAVVVPVVPPPLLFGANVHSVAVGSAILLHAGDVLSTSDTGGAYLMYVQAGQALVFTTDLNQNGLLDLNEITGIAAGNGLQLISFTDIHGDVVTNLNPNGTLTDSDNNGNVGPASSNGRDGQILLPSKITSIEMRSLTVADMTDQNADGVVDGTDVQLRLSPSSYSIFGNIYAGSGFGDQTFVGILPTGAQNPAAHGLLIDSTGFGLQSTSTPEVGSILVGTAASNSHFSFGSAFHESNPQGLIQPFFPGSGVAGGGIFNVRSASTSMKFSIDTFHAGNGGFGAAGGSIDSVIISGDNASGYNILAGDGGAGFSGGAGGSITNFNDAGSLTAHVAIKAGDGGRGLTGPGGNGGQIALLGTVKFVGNVDILLGNGANGFTSGGAGASLLSATIVSVDPTVSTVIDLVTTTRDVDPAGLTNAAVPTIGQIEQIDFNGDGVNDMVFSTSNPSQIVVVFGSNPANPLTPNAVPGTFDVEHPLYLNGPSNAHIAVGDFNADGAPDIVAISGVANDGGISVYLNDGNGNFPSRQQSALPSLSGFVGGPTLGGTGIAVGDFNGDGILDVAEISTVMTQTLVAHNVVEFLYGVADGTGNGSGYFAGDFKRADVAAITLQPTATPPFVDLGSTADGATFIKATALNNTATNDVLVAGSVGSSFFEVIDDSAFAVANNFGFPQENSFGLGQVDTNRNLPVPPPGNNPNLSLVNATLKDFTVVDLDNDGNADIATLTQAPVGYIITHAGDGAGNFVIGSGVGGEAGIYLGLGGTAPNSGFGFDNLAPAAIRTTDSDGDGISSELAVLDYNTVPAVQVYEINLHGGFNQTGATVDKVVGFATPAAYNNAVIAFDTYTMAGTTNVGYGVAVPSSGDPVSAFIDVEGDFPIGGLVPLNQYGLHITMGTGGNGAVGPGGVGGTLGGPLIKTLVLDPVTHLPIVTTSGTIHITLPGNGNFQGIVDLIGADGGNGFTTGGSGGNVQGLTVDGDAFDSNINIVGGKGGFGLTGAGGAGGTLTGNSIINGVNFTAGDGGQGMIGGSGGSIVGNNSPSTFDSETTTAVLLHAGQGAHGVLMGGAGGSVNNFDSYFVTGGLLDYEAGNGGTAVSGAGGSGGSILTSSVNPSANALSGEIYLLAGNGGNGLTGGMGGSINTFINSPVAGVTPTTLSALAGNGGDGITGGGIGGGISSLNVAVSGIQGNISLYPYTRILAGNGGSSFGGTGAVGGSLSSVVSTSQNSALVGVAGRGGDGMVAGGAGGSVTSATLNAAAITGNKVLVLAGDGGDGYGALATTTFIGAQDGGPVSTFGNVAAHGGNGGGISGFTQPITIQTRVDLTAGNGGDTVNYGTSNDSLFNVGVGGSITGVNITGTIGNVNHAVPIKAYNDVNNDGVVDEKMAVFVQNFFVNNATPLIPLDDTLGNVGLVAGAPGRVKGDNPASIAASGSVSGITARSIMSMVAGSVDRIAAIQSVSGISHSDPNGVFGSDKDDPGNANAQGTIDYYNLNGTENHTGPVIGARLLDGAVVAKMLTGISGTRVFKR